MNSYKKIATTHNKKGIPLLNLFINCISARSASQMLSIKGECTFLFLNFLRIGLYHSSANSWFEKFLFLIPLQEVVLSKNLETIEASLRKYDGYQIHHIFDI